jgi:DNA-nicking Smr family endonuclease
MSDDKELFELAMDTLGTKRGARAAPRPTKPRPEGVTVTEDVDFEALMRSSKGPAKDLSKVQAAKATGVTAEGAPAEGAREVVAAPIDRSRYAATAQEAQEFAEAMRGMGAPPPERLEAGTGGRAATPAEDLARRLKRGDVEADAVLDLHGSTQKVARSKLADFIKEARTEGWEVVTIIVGRGLRSDRGEAVLRPLVERWLVEDHRAEVREVHQAPPYMGGSGAWVAAIRTSAR